MSTPRKYLPELRDRAVRLVLEAQKADEQVTLNAAALRVEVNKETLYGWCKQAFIDRGERHGVSTGDAKRIRELEAEVWELK